MSIKLSPIEYLLILQMRNDSSLTLSTAEEDYIKGLRLAGKTSETLLKPKREKWHTYLNYINKVKKDAIESGQDATKATGAYNSAKKLKLDLSPTNPDKLHYMTSQLASEYQKYIASDDVTLTLNGETLPDLE